MSHHPLELVGRSRFRKNEENIAITKYTGIRSTLLLLLIAFITLSFLCSCKEAEQRSVDRGDKAGRTGQPDLQQVTDQIRGNIEFALNLNRSLFDPEKNLLFSPWSLTRALGMTYLGARSTTEQQMAELLDYRLPQELLHPALQTVEQSLQLSDAPEEGDDFRLQLANAIWVQQDYPLLGDYRKGVATWYEAAAYSVDFHNSSQARDRINNWGAEQTRGRISQLVPPGVISSETALVLTNTVWFKAAWQHPFRKLESCEGRFHTLSGEEVAVPMMPLVAELAFHEDDGLQVVELPYTDNRYAMVLLCPAAGEFAGFLQELRADRLEQLLARVTPTRVGLDMPRFSDNSNLLLKEPLSRLGMRDAFCERADFSGINGNRELFIRDVCHSTFIRVDEAGTEAAGATAVVIDRKSDPVMDVRMTLDRPFLYLIRDRQSGTILFIGQMLNPARSI